MTLLSSFSRAWDHSTMEERYFFSLPHRVNCFSFKLIDAFSSSSPCVNKNTDHIKNAWCWGEHLILFAIYLARCRHTCVGFQLIKEPITSECSTCCYKLSVSFYLSGSWCDFRSFVTEGNRLTLMHIYSLILLINQ